MGQTLCAAVNRRHPPLEKARLGKGTETMGGEAHPLLLTTVRSWVKWTYNVLVNYDAVSHRRAHFTAKPPNILEN